MKRRLLFIVLAALSATPLFAEKQAADGTISDVIVYHGRALVTRTIELDKPSGDVELLIENLPERIIPESLYAQATDGIQVLSVRYRVKEVEKDTRTEMKELVQQYEEIEKQLHRAKRDLQLAHNTAGRFSKMWGLGLDGANVSIQRGAFSAESMTNYMTYLAEQGQIWHHKAVDLEEKIKNIEKQLQKLNEEKSHLSAQHKRSIRQALVYINKPSKKAAALNLSYLVHGADWSPQYNLKALADANSVDVEYNAVVHQSSGEDWTNARLALSTAVPALVATPPSLDPLKITLGHPVNRGRGTDLLSQAPMSTPVSQDEIKSQQVSFVDQTQRFVQFANDRRANIAKGIKANRDLNYFASNSQMIEFEADKQLVQQLKKKSVAIKRAEGVSVMYTLPGRLTLPSKSDQQLVTIASIQCPAAFTFVAAPLLTDFVYLQGDLTNTSDTILLPGPADTFRNGEFVGKADMKLVTIGQSFTTGFGVDSQIQVAREFRDKKIDTLWGNRMDEHQYRIEVNNYKGKAVALRLMDRLPWTENEELGIELTDNSHRLSTNTEYIRTQKDKGILRWDLNLKPDTNGKNATVVNYAFMLKYDNDMAIRNIQ